MYTGIHGYTLAYMVLHRYTWLYRWLYTGIHWVYTSIRKVCTWVYTCIPSVSTIYLVYTNVWCIPCMMHIRYTCMALMSSVPFKIRVYTCIPCLHISTHNHYVLYHAISRDGGLGAACRTICDRDQTFLIDENTP